MIYAVMGYATFGQANQRDRIQGKVIDYLATHPTWGVTRNEALIDDTGNPAAFVEVRVLTRAEMVDLYNQAIAEATGQGWLASSWFSYHECSHDEVIPQPCVVEQKTVA